MAQNKKSEFSKADFDLATYTKALAHPARILILKVLAQKQTCVCGELVNELPLAQATVSQHLKELKACGLIKGTIDGPRSCYCIDHDKINELKQNLNQLFDLIAHSKSNENCC